MDIGLITGVAGTIISIIALVISILGFVYHRRRTNMMQEQIAILKEEAEKKKTYEEVSKKIRKSVTGIKEHLDVAYFTFFPLWGTKNDIYTLIHDKKLESLEFNIKPVNLEYVYYENDRCFHMNITSKTEFIKCLKKDLNNLEISYNFSLNFNCNIETQNYSYDLVDACYAIRYLYLTHKELTSFDYLIDAFDNTILNEMKKTLDDLVEVMYESMVNEHRIIFKSDETSDKIFTKLLDNIFGMKAIRQRFKNLDEYCERLNLIQKEFFLKS